MPVAIGTQLLPEESFTKSRDPDNYYPTPLPFVQWMVNRVVDKYAWLSPRIATKVLDVGVGTGHFGAILAGQGYNVWGVENNLERYEARPHFLRRYDYIYQVDAAKLNLRETPVHLIIGNPPYTRGKKDEQSSTTDIILNLYHNVLCPSNGVMALLMPTTYRHGLNRSRLLPMPAAIIDLANRINFYSADGKGGSYPSAYYSIFIWEGSRNPEASWYVGYREVWEATS